MFYLGNNQVFVASEKGITDQSSVYCPEEYSLYLCNSAVPYKVNIPLTNPSLCSGASCTNIQSRSNYIIINGNLYYVTNASLGKDGITLVDDSGVWTRVEGRYLFTNTSQFYFGAGIRDGKLFLLGDTTSPTNIAQIGDRSDWTDIASGICCPSSSFYSKGTATNDYAPSIVGICGNETCRAFVSGYLTVGSPVPMSVVNLNIANPIAITGSTYKCTSNTANASIRAAIIAGNPIKGYHTYRSSSSSVPFTSVSNICGATNFATVNSGGAPKINNDIFVIDDNGYLYGSYFTTDPNFVKIGTSNKWTKVVGQGAEGYSSVGETSGCGHNRAIAINDGKLYEIGGTPGKSGYNLSYQTLIDDTGVWTDVIGMYTNYTLTTRRTVAIYGVRNGILCRAFADGGVATEYPEIKPVKMWGGGYPINAYPLMVLSKK